MAGVPSCETRGTVCLSCAQSGSIFPFLFRRPLLIQRQCFSLFLLGMIIVAWPILTGNEQNARSTVSERSQAYITSKNLLISAADAIERIMTSFKEV